MPSISQMKKAAKYGKKAFRTVRREVSKEIAKARVKHRVEKQAVKTGGKTRTVGGQMAKDIMAQKRRLKQLEKGGY
jgi:ribosome recycling factor